MSDGGYLCPEGHRDTVEMEESDGDNVVIWCNICLKTYEIHIDMLEMI